MNVKKHFQKFSLLFAAAALMASCSSDEPKGGNNLPDDVSGMDAYLRINIQSADMGKATPSDTEGAENGDYVFGSADEHNISNAKFYFYTADKVFMQEGTLANFNGNAGDPAKPNVEYFGQKVLVLKGLTQNTTPTYMLTVLNAPSDFNPGATLDETRLKIMNIKNGEDFIMSTSSYLSDADGFEYGANKLTTSDFLVQDAGTVTPDDVFDGDNNDKHVVEVYVERLAAKVSVNYNGLNVNEDGYVEITVPVAGNPNELNQGATLSTVYVKLSNWGLNATAKESYLTKNIAGLTNPSGSWDWNKAADFRSFWGKSVLWGEDLTTENANFITYAQAKGEWGQNAYCPENTNEVSKIAGTGANAHLTINRNLTHVIFTAGVYEKDAAGEYQPLDMVRYNGSLFKTTWFKDFVLNYLNVNGKLNYYKVSKETTGEDGTVTGREYKQLDATDLMIDFALTEGSDKGTGMVQVVTKLTTEAPKYYVKGTNPATGAETYTATDWTDNAISDLNTALASFDNTQGKTAVANAYKGGAMYYAVPIEHLLKREKTTDAIVEGNYGVVRNHWYMVNVDKILRLGTGVFNPDEGGEQILPPDKPEDPTYYLGARINILSWKIVSQNVDL